ncbi:hypothetical protein, partial [Escherichia coli]|uniref:hypothetical protein n=1 Tax=Escherichia coli TaxID=562 RepID=UPI001BFC6E03
ADRNRSHWSTSKTPSYTKSVSWQHHPFFHRYHPDLFVNMIMPLNDIRLNNNNNCPPFKSSILNPISDKSLIYRFHEYLNIN